MRDWQSQAHVKYYCKYHVVFVPKYRKKSIYGMLRKDIGGILRELCRQRGVEWLEGYAMKDHIHMLLMIRLLECHLSADLIGIPAVSKPCLSFDHLSLHCSKSRLFPVHGGLLRIFPKLNYN